jgi:hypothetical protein
LSTSASASASASASTSATAARLPPPPAGQVTLVELHLEADDLNRLARTAFVEVKHQTKPCCDAYHTTH